MPKRLNTLQTYYIDNNLGLSDVELARTTGATVRQVKARRDKRIGKNREGGLKGEPEQKVINQPNPQREAELVNKANEEAKKLPLVTNQSRPAPAMRIDALIARREGTTSMTGPASELADMFDGIAPDSKGAVVKPFNIFEDESKVHIIRK